MLPAPEVEELKTDMNTSAIQRARMIELMYGLGRSMCTNESMICNFLNLVMATMAGIGNLYGDAGLVHMLYESGVYAERTAHNLMSGKDFDRGMSALKLVDEVLNFQFLKNFNAWCEAGGHGVLLDASLRAQVDDAVSNDEDTLQTSMAYIEERILPLVELFRHEGIDNDNVYLI